MKAQYMFCELWEAENSDYRLQSKNTVAAKKKKKALKLFNVFCSIQIQLQG